MMLTLFSSRKTLGKSKLLQGMTDVHSHLLPGVDDGVPTCDEALQILERLQELGVSRMYLTPHIMADLPGNEPEKLKKQFDLLQQAWKGQVELRLAGEYMLDNGFEQQRAWGLMAMAEQHLLVETSYLSSPPGFLNMLYDLSLDDYVPVLAHPERYTYMEEEDYQMLKGKGYAFQLNLMSLYGVYGRRAAAVSRYLLKGGYYDYVGSDLHRLHPFDETVAHLALSRSEVDRLRVLMENNHSLW